MKASDDFIQRHNFPCWCGASEGTVFCSQSFGRRPFAVLRCLGCGTLRLLPRALAEESAAVELYNTYRAILLTPEQEKQAEARERSRMERVGFRFAPGQRVLDVGCGDGILLEALCRDFRCSGRGIDVDERRIRRAQELRPHARFECGLFDARNVTERYNTIVAQAVLEHVLDPVGFLRDLAAALAPGGAIYVLIPNGASLTFAILRSWWRDLLSVGEHIHLFTPESLAQCAARAGLEVMAFDSSHDLTWPACEFDSARNALITGWAFYREGVKRACSLVASPGRGDILFARLVAQH